MSHRVGFDQVGHVRLVEHPDAGDHGVVSDADAADAVVAGSGHLAGTTGAMAVEPVVRVPGVRVRVVTAEVVTGPGILKNQKLAGQNFCCRLLCSNSLVISFTLL